MSSRSFIPIDVACQDLPLADPVGFADDAFLLHPLDDARRAVVADLQVTLDEARGSLAFPAYNRDGLVIEGVAAATVVRVEINSRLVLFAGDVVYLGRLALIFKEPHDRLDLAVGDERPMDARDAPAIGHVEHVALAQQLLRPGFAQNRSTIDPAT